MIDKDLEARKVRNISYVDAEHEIEAYIQSVGSWMVSVDELMFELRLVHDLVEEVLCNRDDEFMCRGW